MLTLSSVNNFSPLRLSYGREGKGNSKRLSLLRGHPEPPGLIYTRERVGLLTKGNIEKHIDLFEIPLCLGESGGRT